MGNDIIGNNTKIKVVKNKVAPPFKTATVDIMYGVGVSHEGEVLDLASEAGIVDKSGAWYSYQGNKIGQGKENAKVFLVNNPDILDSIEEQVRECYGISVADKKKDKKGKEKKENTSIDASK